MTDSEINSLEEQAWASAEGTCGRDAILALTAELRQARAERDFYLRELIPDACPSGRTCKTGKIGDVDCGVCWLQAAKEAVCQK